MLGKQFSEVELLRHGFGSFVDILSSLNGENCVLHINRRSLAIEHFRELRLKTVYVKAGAVLSNEL